MTDRTWVIVLAADGVQAAVADGFVRTSSGKRAVLARMKVGDRLVLYSPRASHPGGPALRAVTGTGEVTGDQPEEVPGQSEAHRRAAHLTSIEPVPLADIREHLKLPLLRFGSVLVTGDQADALWAKVRKRLPRKRRARAPAA